MKKLIFLAVLGLIFWQQASAQTAERIDQFNFIIKANTDSSLNITEQIAYNFGNNQHHGIYRDIPYKYSRNGYNYNLRISQIKVTDEKGNAYAFTTSNTHGNVEIKIGDPNTYVTGQRDYIISYKAERAINYFSDHDEVYWNATGDNWPVPIASATGVLVLPQTDVNKIQIACFFGTVGSTNSCNGSSESANYPVFGPYSSPGVNELAINFQQSQILPGQGMTIASSVPKGIFAKPSNWQNFWYTIRDNLIFLLPLAVLLAMWLVWRRWGRDPRSALPVVAQYEPPDNLTPGEVAYLATGRSSSLQVSSEIIYLATKGYLRIERIPKQGIFGHEDFRFIKIKPGDDLTNPFDSNVFDKLFLGDEQVLLSEIKKRDNRDLFQVNAIPSKLTRDGYFDKNPKTIRTEYIVGAFLFVILFFYVLFRFASSSATVSVVVSVVIFLLFAYFMPRKTQKGADTMQLIKGLRLYLAVAEKDRLDFENDPEKDPKLFEKLLPYAMALGVSEAWAKKFEGIDSSYQPNWYSDPANAYFNFLLFSSAMNHFHTSMQAVAVASRSGAGAGGSAFGGGGFAGGGFGGGGGGSW